MTRRRCRRCTASAASVASPSSSSTGCPGYEGSRPVRTGNGAHAQLQLDVYGELLDVLWQAARAGTPPSDELVVAGAPAARRRSRSAGASPTRASGRCAGARRHFTHSKVLCWVAFDRAVAMVEQAGYDGPVDRWRAIRDEIHAEVCDKGYDDELGAFTQSFDVRRARRLGAHDPARRLPSRRRSARACRRSTRSGRELTRDGFVLRYDPTDASVDGIGEPEGVFLPCSFWMVEALALAGERDEARALFERLLGARERRRPLRRGVRPRRARGCSATSRRRSRTSRSSPPRTRSRRSSRRTRRRRRDPRRRAARSLTARETR